MIISEVEQTSLTCSSESNYKQFAWDTNSMILAWETKIQTNLIGFRESVLFKPRRKRRQSILAGIPVLHTLHDGPSLQIASATKMMEILRFSHTSIDPGLFLSRHGFSKSCKPSNSQTRYACNECEQSPVFFPLQHRWKEGIYVSTARTNFADERNSYRRTILSGRDRCRSPCSNIWSPGRKAWTPKEKSSLWLDFSKHAPQVHRRWTCGMWSSWCTTSWITNALGFCKYPCTQVSCSWCRGKFAISS